MCTSKKPLKLFTFALVINNMLGFDVTDQITFSTVISDEDI